MNLLPVPWPPLITDAKVPRRIILRDYALTVGAWVALAWFAEHELLLVLSQIHELLGGPQGRPLPDWALWWARLRPYAIAVAFLAVWLVGWGLMAMRRLRGYAQLPQPTPLTAVEQAVRYGCTEADLLAWRALKIAVVHIDPGDRVRVEAGRALPPGRP